MEDKNSIDHPHIINIPAKAGSVVFFMGGSVLHGVGVWGGGSNPQRRACLHFYQSRNLALPGGQPMLAEHAQLAAPRL